MHDNVNFESHRPSQFTMHDNVNFEPFNDIHGSKFSIEWIGWRNQTLRLIPPVSRQICWCGSCRHFRCNDAYNLRKFYTGGSTWQSSMSQICSIGFKFSLMTDHGREVTASLWREAVTALVRCGLALSSINKCLIASMWLSKWGTATGCKTYLMY